MIIKKLGVLLLAVIIGLTLAGTPAIYANNTNNDTCSPGNICNNTTNYRITILLADFLYNPMSTHRIGYGNGLHIKQGQTIFYRTGILSRHKNGEWRDPIFGFKLFPVYLYIYHKGDVIWEKKINPHSMVFHKLPYLSKGNYTMLFVYHGSQKHKLLPSNKTIPLYIE